MTCFVIDVGYLAFVILPELDRLIILIANVKALVHNIDIIQFKFFIWERTARWYDNGYR